jgi:ABC-type antimicrobial peptide transport system permease subunit
MVLGALGLLLGTVGMAIVLFRSIQERKSELSLLQAVGYRYKTIRNLVIREYFTLLLVGSLIGSFSAILATLPSLLSTNINSSLYLIILIVFVLLINGLFWISLIARIALMNRSLINSIRNE